VFNKEAVKHPSLYTKPANQLSVNVGKTTLSIKSTVSRRIRPVETKLLKAIRNALKLFSLDGSTILPLNKRIIREKPTLSFPPGGPLGRTRGGEQLILMYPPLV
jgi:hypothetical protein